MKRTYFLSLALAAVLAGGCSRKDRDQAAAPPNGSAPVGTSGAASDVKRADKDFVHDVAIANMAELDMARLALERGTDPSVKKFAQMMVDDHTKAGSKLQDLAGQHHIDVPAAADDDHRDKATKLGEKKGMDFDRDYADAMVDGHQDFVDKLEPRIDKDTLAKWKADQVDASGKKVKAKSEAVSVTAEKSDDPATQSLNQFAADTYPVAFAHLQAAKELQKGLKRRTTTP